LILAGRGNDEALTPAKKNTKKDMTRKTNRPARPEFDLRWESGGANKKPMKGHGQLKVPTLSSGGPYDAGHHSRNVGIVRGESGANQVLARAKWE